MASSGGASSASTWPTTGRHQIPLQITGHLSSIEKLPIELLVMIFRVHKNCSLPKSSLYLGMRLSHWPLLEETVIEAFGPYWNLFWGRQSVARPNYVTETWDHKLQSAVLQCRWATLPFILKVKDTWISRDAAAGNIRRYHSLWFGFEEEFDHFFDNRQNRVIADLRQNPRTLQSCEKDLKEEFDRFEGLVKNQSQLSGIWLYGGEELDHRTLVPDHVIRGPWTEETIKFLFWMLSSGATCSITRDARKGSEEFKNWYKEVAIPGLKAAIKEGELCVLHLFNYLDKRARLLDGDLMFWAFKNAGGDIMAVINTLLRWRIISWNRKGNPRHHKGFERRLRNLQVEKESENDLEAVSIIKSTFALSGWKERCYW